MARAKDVSAVRPAEPAAAPTVSAVVPAAGEGKRLGLDVPKAFVSVGGKPLIVHTVLRLLEATSLVEIIVPTPPGWARRCRAMLAPAVDDRSRLVCLVGGATRTASVRRALRRLEAGTDLVLIHDAARPLVPVRAVRRAVKVAARQGAAVVAIPACDTIKEADRRGRVRRTLDRRDLWQVQTPQVFRRGLLVSAYARTGARSQATDDSLLVERTGVVVQLVEGSPENFKVTTPLDLTLCEALLATDH